MLDTLGTIQGIGDGKEVKVEVDFYDRPVGDIFICL